MSKAEKYQGSASMSMGNPAYEYTGNPYVQNQPEDDRVVWPPVIARIRDLDKPTVSAKPSLSPIATPASAPISTPKVEKPSKPIRNQVAEPRRKNPNVSSRLIALAGIIIFFVAIVPFMHLREDKGNTETADTAWQPTSPVSKAETVQAASGTIKAAEPAEKAANPSLIASPTTLTSQPKPTTSVVPPTPSLLPVEKKESPETMLANPTPAKAVAPRDALKEQMAAQLGTIRAVAPQLPSTFGTPVVGQQPHAEASQVTEMGEFVALPKRPLKPELTNNQPATGANTTNPSTVPQNRPMVSWPNDNQGTNATPMTNPNVSPNLPPAATVPGNNRNIYQADLRNDPRSSYQYTPDYRLNNQPQYYQPTNTQPTSQPDNRINNPANGNPYPASNMRGGVMTSPQPQYNPNQPAAAYPTNPPANHLTYPPINQPTNQPTVSNPPQGTAVVAGPNGTYPPSAANGGNAYYANGAARNPYPNNAYNTYGNPYNHPYGTNQQTAAPATGYPNTNNYSNVGNPNVGNISEGYRIPPATENPPTRY
jgi:hypothetical protein